MKTTKPRQIPRKRAHRSAEANWTLPVAPAPGTGPVLNFYNKQLHILLGRPGWAIKIGSIDDAAALRELAKIILRELPAPKRKRSA
jgi:hypothetical protein